MLSKLTQPVVPLLALYDRDTELNAFEYCLGLMKDQWIELCPGIRRRTLTHGTALYQMIAQLDAGSTMPAHSHPQEQITHVLQGRVVMVLDGVRHDLRAGDSLLIPGNVSHGAETIEQTLVLDTFSPPRTEYLAIDEQQKSSAGA